MTIPEQEGTTVHKLRTAIASLAAVALTAGLAVGAVATDEPSEDQLIGVFSIEDMTWLLTSQLVDGEMVDVPERLTVSLHMEDGDAGGNGGCNSYFTSYEMDGFEVTFGMIGSTKMACRPPVMDLEQAYFANLGQVASYQSGGIQMALLDADGNFLLEFDLAPEATVVGSWVAQGINNGKGGVETNALTPSVTAVFDQDGQLSGVDGCNNYSTTYEVEGESITIAPEIATTMMACAEPGLADLSQQYFAALGASATWAVDASGSLELRDADGSLQVKYLPAQ
jgi:heat shock protein HslJ